MKRREPVTAGGCLALLLAAVLSGCAGLPPGQLPADAAPVAITVLHTNDHHGRFWRSREGEAGLAARKTLVDAVRAEVAAQGGHVLLLDAGDVNSGVPESDLQQAEPDFRGMSLMGYDAMAVGNHEFDRAAAVQQQQRGQWSQFPWLSANVLRNGQPAFEPYRVFRLGAVRVAVLGLTTEDTRLFGVADRYPGLQFVSAQKAAMAAVPQLRGQADVVIALAHLGHYADGRHGTSAPGDVELARAVPGIDLVVGGHTHTLVCMLQENVRTQAYEPGGPCAPDRQNGAWIVQAGDRGRFVGRADFTWHAGRFELQRYRLLPVNLKGGGAPWAEDAQMLHLLQPFQSRGQWELGQPIGQARGRFDGERGSVRQRRTQLGMLITEAMRRAGDADFAVISSGGIRASLPEGTLTLRDLLTALPFGNRLVVVTMSGAEVLAYARAFSAKAPGSGAFAQYGGLSFTGSAGALSELRVNGSPVVAERLYRMAVPSFVADGGDGWPDLRAHPGYRDTGRVDSQVLREFIAGHGVVDAADFKPPELP